MAQFRRAFWAYLSQGPNGDVGCWIPNWERPGIGIPMTQVTKARIPARISMKKTIQRNILALRRNNGAGRPKLR